MGLRHDVIHRAAVDPTVNDDGTVLEGTAPKYKIGDDWLNTVSNELFQVIDLTTAAAVWINMTNALSGAYVVVDGAIEIGDDAVLAPTQITSNQNDYNPTGWVVGGEVQVSFLVLDADGNYNLTGLEAPVPAKRMRVTIFNNSATQNLTFVNNSGSSDAENRFLSNGNVTLNEKEAIDFIYSPLELRWIPVTK